MKKIKLMLSILLIGIVTFAIPSCNSEQKSASTDSASVDTAVYTDGNAVTDSAIVEEAFTIPDTQELAEEATKESQENSISTKSLFISKGAVWKMWEKLFKDFMKNNHFKNPTYLGISNTVDIGSLFNEDNQLLWNIDKVLNAEQKAKVVTLGNKSPLKMGQKAVVSFESLINAELPSSGIEGELSAALKNQKDLTVSVNSCQIDRIDIGPFKRLVNTSTDGNIMDFKQEASIGTTKIIYQVARINGFSSIIKLDKAISAGLKAGLEKGIITQIGDADAKLKFEYKSANEIAVSSIGSFIVFADIVNASKLITSGKVSK